MTDISPLPLQPRFHLRPAHALWLYKFHRLADRYEVYIAKRGNKDRNQAIRTALQSAEREFEQKFGMSRGGDDAWNIVISDPKQTTCLQAVDYFLWAVQRFYEVRVHAETGEEVREDRFLNMLWPQIAGDS